MAAPPLRAAVQHVSILRYASSGFNAQRKITTVYFTVSGNSPHSLQQPQSFMSAELFFALDFFMAVSSSVIKWLLAATLGLQSLRLKNTYCSEH